MVFSRKFLGLVCFLFLLIPVVAYAQEYTTKVRNETVNIVIKPANNTIIIPPQNNTQTEKLLGIIAENEQRNWTQGEILISSASIFAFVGFGSFLIIRYETKRPETVFMFLFVILVAVWGIGVLHLYVLYSIINGNFNNVDYKSIILDTIAFLSLIIYGMVMINYMNMKENRARRLSEEWFNSIKIQTIRQNEMEQNVKKVADEIKKDKEQGLNFKINSNEKKSDS